LTFEPRQDHDPGVGRAPADVGNGLESVHLRHGEVEHYHVGLPFDRDVDPGGTVFSLADNFEAVVDVEQGAQQDTQVLSVVYENNCGCGCPGFCRTYSF
jgi:hypothetical protein